jgi:hypothetical protein
MVKIPESITEAEVLALIEGDMGLLPIERREVVRAAVAADPALSRLVGEIRADTTAVVGLSRVTAPSTIRGRVVEELRKPAPRPEPIREPAGGAIPVSAIVVTRESPWRKIAERAPVRRLAAAAGLLLATGAGVWLVSLAIRYGQEHAGAGGSAVAQKPTNDRHALPSVPESTPVPETGPALADAGAPTNPGIDPAPGDNTPGIAAAHAADTPGLAPSAHAIAPSEAVALAREGRLVLRVRAVHEQTAQRDIDRLAAATARDMHWRPLQPWDLPEVAVALRGHAPDVPYAAANPPATVPTPDVADDGTSPKPDPIEPIGKDAAVAEALSSADLRPVYSVELDENERDLAALAERLTRSKSHIAEFMALDAPLPSLAPSTDPAAVLWWTRSPAGWTRRVSVPIVLETIE